MENNTNNKIVIELKNGHKLVAERNPDPNFENEIMIGIIDPYGYWIQDLATVRECYTINGNLEPETIDDKFDVLVYANADEEDYTHNFVVDLYKDPKEKLNDVTRKA